MAWEHTCFWIYMVKQSKHSKLSTNLKNCECLQEKANVSYKTNTS